MSSALPLPTLSTQVGRARTASSPITVVLADDHERMRRSLRLLLQGEADVEVVAEAPDLSTAIRHVFRYTPHVLLLDLRIADGSNWEAIPRLRMQAPGTQIIVVTMEGSPAGAQKAIDVGAIGYVLKDNADRDLPAAIRCAVRGERYVSSRVGGSSQPRPLPARHQADPRAA